MNRLNTMLRTLATEVLTSKEKTDKMTLASDLQVAINSAGNPYLRWTNGQNLYQFVLHSTGISYQKSTNGGSNWTTVWTK